MTTLSELLRLCRKEGHLTQQKLVDDLSVASPLFKDLNSVTLSRWETGTTTPGLQKKKSLLRYLFTHYYFETPKCADHLKQSFQYLSKPLSKQLDHKYQEIVGNMAPFKVKADQYHFGFLKTFSDIRLTYIINIERASHPDHYYTLDLPTLRSWIEHESSFCLGCTLNEEHLGHIILLKLKPYIAHEVIHNRRSVFTIRRDDLSPINQQGTYLIHTFFGLNSDILAMLSTKAIQYLLTQQRYSDKVATFITREENLKLVQQYGHKIVAKGTDSRHHYRWYATQTPLAEIIFSDLVIRYLFV